MRRQIASLALLGGLAAGCCHHIGGKADCGYNPADYPIGPPTPPYPATVAPPVPVAPPAPAVPDKDKDKDKSKVPNTIPKSINGGPNKQEEPSVPEAPAGY